MAPGWQQWEAQGQPLLWEDSFDSQPGGQAEAAWMPTSAGEASSGSYWAAARKLPDVLRDEAVLGVASDSPRAKPSAGRGAQ